MPPCVAFVSSAALLERGPDVVSDVLGPEVDGGMEGRDPFAVAIEDADVGGVEIGVAGVDGRENSVGLPDRAQLPNAAQEVVDLAERAALEKEAPHMGGRVDRWVDGDRERGH